MSRAGEAYKCDRCGDTKAAGRLPRGWKRRENDHICPKCWPKEPEELSAVWKYGTVQGSIQIPEEFWHQQKAAKCLWDALVGVDESSMKKAIVLRAEYAPEESAKAETFRVTANGLWERVRETGKKLKILPRAPASDGPMAVMLHNTQKAALQEEFDDLKKRGLAASQAAKEAYSQAKAAAKKAGADETFIWEDRDKVLGEAPRWYYRMIEIEGRSQAECLYNHKPVERQFFLLPRSLADQVVEEYKRAWSAWTKHRGSGRGMPRRHGQAIRDRARAIFRYTNGQTWDALVRGTPRLTIKPLRTNSRGKTLAEVTLGVTQPPIKALVVFERPVPLDKDAIRAVTFVGERRYWDKWQWSLQFTCRIPKTRVAPSSALERAIAVDLRWRRSDDENSLEVAHWLSSDGKKGVVAVSLTFEMKRQARHNYPSSWRQMTALQTEIDLRIEALKEAVWGSPPNTYDQPFRLMHSGGLLRGLRADRWPEHKSLLEVWAKWHTSKMRQLGRLRQRCIGRRDDQYYKSAHDICRQSRYLLMEAEADSPKPMDLKRLAEGNERDSLGSPVAGDQRHLVAPHRFREILIRVADKYGVEVIMIPAKNTSATCPDCRQIAPKEHKRKRTCPAGHSFDPVRAATTEMLARWKEIPPDTDDTKHAVNS